MGQASTLYQFDGTLVDYDNPLFVTQKYRIDPIVNLYMYRQDATPSLTSNTSVGDKILSIDSNTNVSDGDAITLYEGSRIFQSLVVSSTANSVTIQSGVDYGFTTDVTIEVGPWNMAVNGSSSEQTFILKSPPSSNYVIKSVNGSILDQTAMDDSLFGGLSELSNGIVLSLENDKNRQFALIVNNTGFFENGFTIEYASKAPAGYYGFRYRKSLDIMHGVVIVIDTDSTLKLIIRDNLSDLDQFTMSILGYVRE